MLKTRVAWLDYVRALAIISVVAVHSLEMVYKLNVDKLMEIGTASILFRDVIITFGRIGVPFFLALTGYLHIDKDFSSGDKIISFYKKNLLPLWITTEVWIIIYFIQGTLFGEMEVDFIVLLRDMLFVKTYCMGHLWYMPMIMGMYIAIPFISNAIKNISSKVLSIPYIVVIVLFFVFNFYNILKQTFGWEFLLEKKIDTSFLGGVYGVYMIFGVFCKRGDIKKIKTPVIWLISAFGFAFTVSTLWLVNKNGYDYNLWYDFPGIFLASMFAFEGISRIKLKEKISSIINPLATQISVLSLGMYFIHKPLIYNLNYDIMCSRFGREIAFVLLFLEAFVISFIIAFILSKIPVVKKILLLIK